MKRKNVQKNPNILNFLPLGYKRHFKNNFNYFSFFLQNTDELLSKYKIEYEALLRLANLQNEKYKELQRQYKILARQHSQLERDAYNKIIGRVTILDQSHELTKETPREY